VKVKELCQLLGYSKQAYYQQIRYQEQQAFDEYLIIELIHRKRIIWKKGSGRNLLAALKEDFSNHDISIGRDKFFDLLRRHGLLTVRKSYKAITTMSYHHYHKYTNLIKDKVPLKSNEIWVSDITYIWLSGVECFAYLSLITDLYSHRIMGYFLSETLRADGPLNALKTAVEYAGASKVEGCIHHSDRGVQYCCHDYIRELSANKFKISMTQSGNPLENAVAERVNGIVKYEFSDNRQLTFADFKTAQNQIPGVINFYNEQRPHSSIERLTPNVAYAMEGELKRCWKNYNKKKQVEDLPIE
jgi:transposase InsO family protein